MNELAEVAKGSKQILAVTEFLPGHRYEDFDPDSGDHVAAYGIGALVAGKVAVKAGLFKVILAFLAKGWKLALVAVVALGAVIRRIFGGGSQSASVAEDVSELPTEAELEQ